MLRTTRSTHAGSAIKKGGNLSLTLNTIAELGTLSLFCDDVALRYAALWTFVCGAALVWLIMHLRRNARLRKSVSDSQIFSARLKDILHHSREVIYSFDLKTKQFNHLSPACLSLTGFSPSELDELGPNGLIERVHSDDKDNILQRIKTLRHRTKDREWIGNVDLRFRRKDGHYCFINDLLHVSYNSDGDAISLSGSIRDVTQNKHLEESMRILERKFQDSQKMAGLGLLASSIAHDFNNLMTVVLGNAELALLDCGGSDDGALDEIKRTSLRAAELANQMLVYTGKTTVVVDNIDLSSVVKEMGALLSVSISKKVKLQYSLGENLRPVRGDISQLRQVAMNLITNASEAIGDQSGVIAISIHEVNLRQGDLKNVFSSGAILEGPHVLLEVSDTGRGMSEETLQKMFEPQFTTKVTGRGLGLASLLNAVQRHNGVVDVKSKVGEGTVFCIYFPVEEEIVRTEENSPKSTEGWSGYGTVLIADDEEAIRDITATLLERIGFRVIAAEDGEEVVEQYIEHSEEISVLLIDINMPRLNGLEAALRIRHINPKLPVLFMSGYPRRQIMDRLGKQPHTNFVKKPFQSQELADAIRGVMENRSEMNIES